MNLFDLIGSILIISGAVVFWKKGILGVLLPVFAIVTSMWMSFNFSLPIIKILGSGMVRIVGEKPWVGYIIAFLLYLLVIGLIAFIIKNFINVTPLKIIDSILGGGFGIILSSLLIMVVMFIMLQIGDGIGEYVKGSVLYFPVFRGFLQ